jgi:hypothetical protein
MVWMLFMCEGNVELVAGINISNNGMVFTLSIEGKIVIRMRVGGLRAR